CQQHGHWPQLTF
nr:immunoglobulin light chain junction region [Macaca mulatta]MPN90865.1 immunoglobulin light chain junction region [Macaca mulatta]MPN90879.1 immunoglobulin light chain junction region [Macaca mulatta]MPN91082.1 immunoglobulin light chain junction region [Macaca mulatta]MPN91323.1 immunoglobulin light chain junction region [Macaca mulatta]